MAAGAEEKTEEPTDKKKRDARKKGNIPKSKDLSAAAFLLVAITSLKYLGPLTADYTKVFFEKVLDDQFSVLEIPRGKEILPHLMEWLVLLCGPFLAIVFFTAYVVDLFQVGFLFTTETLKLDFKKLNPVAGFKRMFALRNLVMLAMNIAKLAAVMGLAWWTIMGEVENVLAMVEMETVGMLKYAAEHVLALAQRLAILLFVLGYADWRWQKYKHNKDLKMTKQEIKEEYKQMEGDPAVKQKRRQKQMELAQQRMMQEVPQAEVVVRNPTHFAVAIKYKPDMKAPVVVAKGKDHLAMQIIEVAREAKVPCVENPPLARELYKKVEIGDEVPPELYEAVAEILAFVYRANNSMGTAGHPRPQPQPALAY